MQSSWKHILSAVFSSANIIKALTAANNSCSKSEPQYLLLVILCVRVHSFSFRIPIANIAHP